ncbi:MAG: DUF6316 family protein, partial [Pseudomonadota bacterium]
RQRVFLGPDGRWYFRTRDAGQEGPFSDRRGALRVLDRYVRDCTLRRRPGFRWPRSLSLMRVFRRSTKSIDQLLTD